MGCSRYMYRADVCDGDYCPGDCDGCHRVSEIWEAEYRDNLLNLLDEEWFKGSTEQRDSIAERAYDMTDEELASEIAMLTPLGYDEILRKLVSI